MEIREIMLSRFAPVSQELFHHYRHLSKVRFLCPNHAHRNLCREYPAVMRISTANQKDLAPVLACISFHIESGVVKSLAAPLRSTNCNSQRLLMADTIIGLAGGSQHREGGAGA